MPTAREQTRHLLDLLRKEHHALAEFLVALSAFDAARGWIDLGYRSLFEFLLRELDLPRGPAYYRMTAAGLIQKYPELVEPLRDGRLHLSSITQLAKVITPETAPRSCPASSTCRSGRRRRSSRRSLPPRRRRFAPSSRRSVRRPRPRVLPMSPVWTSRPRSWFFRKNLERASSPSQMWCGRPRSRSRSSPSPRSGAAST